MVDDLDKMADRVHMAQMTTDKVNEVVTVNNELEDTTQDPNYYPLIDGSRTVEL